jgi:hypothetical protein
LRPTSVIAGCSVIAGMPSAPIRMTTPATNSPRISTNATKLPLVVLFG